MKAAEIIVQMSIKTVFQSVQKYNKSEIVLRNQILTVFLTKFRNISQFWKKNATNIRFFAP